jgi:hypothetical protein
MFVETEIPVKALDSLTLRPDIVKIDVEGYEIPVLEGMAKTIKRWLPILMIEYNDRNFETIAAWMTQLGYQILTYDCRAKHLIPYQGQNCLNLFYVHPSNTCHRRWDQQSRRGVKFDDG